MREDRNGQFGALRGELVAADAVRPGPGGIRKRQAAGNIGNVHSGKRRPGYAAETPGSSVYVARVHACATELPWSMNFARLRLAVSSVLM